MSQYTPYIVSNPTLSYDGGSVSATSVISNTGGGNPWMGRAGMAMQAGGSIISGFAQIQQANDQIKQSSRQLAFTENAIYDTYAQLFEELGDKNRRLYAAQDVAVGASGLAASSGSVAAVLDEATNAASKELKRMNTRMKQEVQKVRSIARAQRKAAEKSRRYAAISTAINVGAAAFGGGG